MQRASAILRVATPAELESVRQFYQDNHSPYVPPRGPQELEGAIKRGRVFVIVQESQIVAAGGVFFYDEDNPLLVEVSDTIVTPPVQGFGLQRFLLKLRVASVLLNESVRVRFTAAVVPTNEESLPNVRKVGYEDWPSPDSCVYRSCGDCPNRDRDKERPCCCDYFMLPEHEHRSSIKDLLDLYSDDGIILKRRSGDELVLSVQCRVLSDADNRAELADIVEGR